MVAMETFLQFHFSMISPFLHHLLDENHFIYDANSHFSNVNRDNYDDSRPIHAVKGSFYDVGPNFHNAILCNIKPQPLRLHLQGGPKKTKHHGNVHKIVSYRPFKLFFAHNLSLIHI